MTIVFAGCPATAWDQVRDSEDIDDLRAFIYHNPKDIHVPEAVRRIAYLEYRRAVAADTRYAYRMFLERHPDSVRAFEVKRRLEHLDFIRAKRQGSLEALLDFLRNWPGGSYTTKARELADGLNCQRLLKTGDPDALETFLSGHPDSSCRDQLLVLLEKLRFERAAGSGSVAGLIEFIHDHASSSLAKPARSLLTRRQVEALVRAGRFEKVRAVLKNTGSDLQAELEGFIQNARLDWIRSSLDPALIRKSARSFDSVTGKELRRWAAKISARRRSYAKLAEATALLRDPLVPQPTGDPTVVDPRERWLDAERLALSPQEETAEFLLDLLGDSFLEVRKRALESLREVVDSLGPVRAGMWLAGKKNQLAAKAQAGILLLKLSVLHELSGRPQEALRRLEEEAGARENPDPFLLYYAAELAGRLDRKNQAATLTDRLSLALLRFHRQRLQAWEGLWDSDRGWLTLRQVFGAWSLWSEALAPYLPDENGRVRYSAAEEMLGHWLERSRKDLQALGAWLDEEERKWKLRTPAYVVCGAPGPEILAVQKSASREWEAVVMLVFSGLPEAQRTVAWAAACHPRRSTRRLAAVMPQVAALSLFGRPGKNL